MPRRPTAETAHEAASMLRRLLDLLPSRGGRDEAIRRQVWGAALGLDAAAGADIPSPPTLE